MPAKNFQLDWMQLGGDSLKSPAFRPETRLPGPPDKLNQLEKPVSTAYAEGELEETPEQQDSITRW
jgi:hypothetical protein